MIKSTDRLKMHENEGYTGICSVSELKENSGRRFIVNDAEIAVFKIDNEIFAVSNVCPHQQTRLIYDGFIEDGFVVCPAHGWKFNLRTGKKDNGSNGLQIYPVRVVDHNVFVKVTEKKYKW